MPLRAVIIAVHLALGIVTGLFGALMAGTGAVMAFADSYVDALEYRSRRVDPLPGAEPKSLEALVALVSAEHPESPVKRIALGRDPRHAYAFHSDPQRLDFIDPYTGEVRPGGTASLRRTLHKGVEQWHRFLGFSGDRKETGKRVMSWANVVLIPLLLTGLVLWWPARFRWTQVRGQLLPWWGRGGSRRSWHTALGFWALPFLLLMVCTATTHSFAPVRDLVIRAGGTGNPSPRAHDSVWAPNLPDRTIHAGVAPLTPDQLRAIADRETPGWTTVDLVPAPPASADGQTDPARVVARAPGWGPAFFPIVIQVDPGTGEVLDTHSWGDLSGGTRLLAWARWLHKGEAFGRTGQLVAGAACLVMLALVYTGWALALRRLIRRRPGSRPPSGRGRQP